MRRERRRAYLEGRGCTIDSRGGFWCSSTYDRIPSDAALRRMAADARTDERRQVPENTAKHPPETEPPLPAPMLDAVRDLIRAARETQAAPLRIERERAEVRVDAILLNLRALALALVRGS